MSADLTLYKYRIWCNTENAYVYTWLDENQATPTTCPNNTGDSINSNTINIVETRSPTSVEIKQESIPTNQNYRFDTQAFTALANQTTVYTFSYKKSVSVLEAQFVSAEENRGDTWSWVISPNTLVGVITSDVSASDTVINVSSTVLQAVKVGFDVKITDGVNTDNLGEVIDIDTGAGTITVDVAATQSFLASAPTTVLMSIYFIKNSEFGHPWKIVYGEGKIKSSYVPKNTTVQVEYTNNSETVDKRIVCDLELMF